MNELRLKSIELSELFISEIDKLSIDLNLVSPRDPYFEEIKFHIALKMDMHLCRHLFKKI